MQEAGPRSEQCRIALFPIPDLVAFPGAMVPLHVFEPRYREMLAEFGTLPLKEVLAPAITMAEGYPIEADLVRNVLHLDNLTTREIMTPRTVLFSCRL